MYVSHCLQPGQCGMRCKVVFCSISVTDVVCAPRCKLNALMRDEVSLLLTSVRGKTGKWSFSAHTKTISLCMELCMGRPQGSRVISYYILYSVTVTGPSRIVDIRSLYYRLQTDSDPPTPTPHLTQLRTYFGNPNG